MATAPQPKSILKKAAPTHVAVPPNVNIAPPKSDAEARNLRVALAHAEQIQTQKDFSLRILQHIEDLSLLPSTADPVPPNEIKQFKEQVALFQPSDYSSLLEERNVNGLCGYTLCIQGPRQQQKGRQWLRPEGERRFCSNDCARKALYVRAQLDETPAWERRGGIGTEIKLKDEESQVDLPIRMKENRTDQERKELADERGEQPASKKVTLVTDEVVEKQPSRANTADRVGFKIEDLAHESVEGYRVSSTKYGKDRKPGSPD